MPHAEFRSVDDGFIVVFPPVHLKFAISRLRHERDELYGFLDVQCALPGARTVNGSLSMGTFNFSSPRARRERAKHLETRIRLPKLDLDMEGLLEEVCQLVVQAVQCGEPSVDLRTVAHPGTETEYDVDGFRFPQRHSTIDFGDGASGKSLLNLYVGGTLAKRGLRVGLFDWELDAAAHRKRLEQIFGREMPEVRYVRCERPLVHEVDRLRKIVRDDRLDFVLFDSIGYACPGPPEAAEHAMSYFRAVRQLGEIGSLHVAHIRQGDNNDQRPFGSTFWHNSARSTWFVKLGTISPDGQCLSIGLFNRKATFSALRPAVAFTIAFDNGRTFITPVNIATIEELAAGLPITTRMMAALARGPLTLADLAQLIDAKTDSVDKTARRKSELFTRVHGPDGITRIALTERRTS